MFLFIPRISAVGRLVADDSYAYDQVKLGYSSVSGAVFETTVEWRNVAAIRNFTPLNKDVRGGIYDDIMLIVWLEKIFNPNTRTSDTKKRCIKLSMNTDPNYRYLERGTDGKDADKDGKPDIGMLPPGAYRYLTVKGWSSTLKKYVFRMQGINNVLRDINRDGYFDEKDTKLIVDASAMIADDMHIHQGGNTDTWSAGCQTLKLSHWNIFSEQIEKGRKAGQKQFTYLLVNG